MSSIDISKLSQLPSEVAKLSEEVVKINKNTRSN